MASLLRKWCDLNVALSKRVESFFPHTRIALHERFHGDFARCVDKGRDNAIILDVGGGRSCPTASLLSEETGLRLVAVDLSRAELARNSDTRLKVCADASKGLPFADGAARIVASRFLLEHLPDTDAFVAETARVLAADGTALHLFAGKHTPFATLGRVLPAAWSRRLIARIYPDQVGILGYTVHYDHCTYRQFLGLLRKHGLTPEDSAVSYHQSAFAYAVFPLFVVSACYDAVIHALNIKALGAALYVRAGRTAAETTHGSSE